MDEGTEPNEVPSDVVAAVGEQAEAEAGRRGPPEWLSRFVWQSLWKVVVVGLAVTSGLIVAIRARHLIALLVISVFFALAMIPAVKFLHERWGWRRGAAVGVIYAGLLFFVGVMVLLLIPAVADFAGEIGDQGDEWISDLNEWTEDQFGITVVSQSSGDQAAVTADDALSQWADRIAGLASSGIGLVFDLATIGLFTFYFAADYERILRALMSRMPPHRQRIFGWVTDTAIEQTGGYFYSRLLLMVINGSLFFAVMVAVGVPVAYAAPLSLFEGFVAEFIPAVGTYIGAAVPILVTLADQGLAAALILLVWTVVYQQAENYWLSPRISARTMELNGGVAFGAALAGGAIAGPMGAFMSLPVAALITAVVANVGATYEVAYPDSGDTGSPGGVA